jgi:hypothetical protein
MRQLLKPEVGVAPLESATAESGTTSEEPLTESSATVPDEAEPPVDENVNTPALVESIQVMAFQ